MCYSIVCIYIYMYIHIHVYIYIYVYDRVMLHYTIVCCYIIPQRAGGAPR